MLSKSFKIGLSKNKRVGGRRKALRRELEKKHHFVFKKPKQKPLIQCEVRMRETRGGREKLLWHSFGGGKSSLSGPPRGRKLSGQKRKKSRLWFRRTQGKMTGREIAQKGRSMVPSRGDRKTPKYVGEKQQQRYWTERDRLG